MSILETGQDALETITETDPSVVLNFFQTYFSDVSFLLKIAVIYFFIIWASLVIWVTKDITNRTSNILLQIMSILTVLIFTPLGVFIYFLIRPQTTLFERYYEDEYKTSLQDEENFQKTSPHACPYCNGKIESDFLFCPHCESQILTNCQACQRQIRTSWTLCPYCGTKQESKIQRSIFSWFRSKKQASSRIQNNEEQQQAIISNIEKKEEDLVLQNEEKKQSPETKTPPSFLV